MRSIGENNAADFSPLVFRSGISDEDQRAKSPRR